MNIFVNATETDFILALKGLGYHVEQYAELIQFQDLQARVHSGDIIFWHEIPSYGFYESKANVIVITSSPHETEEYTAAKAGAFAYIASNLPDHLLRLVIENVSKGQLWMTRNTIAKIFERYSALMQQSANLSDV